jgi:hypothetical protein
LRQTPKQARADWEKAAAKWKAELDRSNAFEKKLADASIAGAKGCSVALKKDADKLFKGLKATTYEEVIEKVTADPIANVLLRRLATCYAVDNIPGSGALRDLVQNGRDMRGPRSAGHFALLDALAAAKKDRPRLLLSMTNYWQEGSPTLEHDGSLSGALPGKYYEGEKGVVKAVKKVPEGLEIVFKTEKITFPEENCIDDTNHPSRIRMDGTIEYYQHCKATGKMLSQDNTPHPIVVPPIAADGVAPGVYVVPYDAGGQTKSGEAFGFVLFTKASAKDPKLKTFLGFTL